VALRLKIELRPEWTVGDDAWRLAKVFGQLLDVIDAILGAGYGFRLPAWAAVMLAVSS
jgi:hypothetical protein